MKLVTINNALLLKYTGDSEVLQKSTRPYVLVVRLKYKEAFRLVESGILDQPFQTVVFAAAVFDIYQHTELILKRNLLKLWIIKLVAKCICHSSQAHFD